MNKSMKEKKETLDELKNSAYLIFKDQGAYLYDVLDMINVAKQLGRQEALDEAAEVAKGWDTDCCDGYSPCTFPDEIATAIKALKDE